MREERSEQSGENIPLLSLLYFVFLGQRMQTRLPVSVSHLVGPHYPVKREGGLEQTRVYGHAVVYANTDRADGRVEAILPELGVFGKRPKSTGQYHHS